MHLFFRKLMIVLFVLLAQSGQAQERLVITPHMVINISARGDEWILFDDQRLTTTYDCEIPQTDNQWNFYDAVWNGKFFFYPVEVIVDFGTQQQLTKLCLRKGGGPNANAPINVHIGTPTNWNLLMEHTPGGAECYDLNPVTTQFVKFTFTSTQAKIREIEFYNTTKNTPICAPAPQGNQTSQACGSPRFLMEAFIGSNTNLDIPPAKANAVGFVRNYHGIFLSEGYDRPDYPGYPNNEYNWRPEFDVENFDYDFFFQGFQDLGMQVGNSIHRASPYLTTFAYKTGDLSYNAAVPFNDGTIGIGQFIKVTERKPFSERFYPIQIDMVADDPNMYVEFADIMYQFTSRYGTNPAARNLKVAPNNTPRSGLASVQYLENWNEPDKWWHKSSVESMSAFLDPWVEEQLGYFNPFEYAAMSSACYDGNGVTAGVENVVRTRYPNGHPSNAAPVGIQAADPNMKLVMAGLSELNTDYVRALMFWFKHYRPDIEFPFSVINFHDYSNNGQAGAPLGTHALSPEEYGLKEKLQAVTEFRDRYLPEVELWMSEFGYDSHPRSIQSADCAKFCNNDCDSDACKEKFREIQGQWIVRSFLEIAAAGIDRAMVFNMRDGSPEASAGLYQTSGMTTYRGDRFQNKNSWYYVSSMKRALEGTKFDPSFVHDDPSVRMYRFTTDCSAEAQKTVYAIWSPTSRSGTNVPIKERYQIELPASEATLIRLVDGDMDGQRSKMRPANGKFLVDVSERPKFIVLGELAPDLDGCACDYLKYEATGDANLATLNDEHALIGGPLCVEGDTMYTEWNAQAGHEAILDLRAAHELHSILIYSDTLANGHVEIYHGTPGDWTLFNTWDTRNVTSYRWKVFDNLDIPTRYIRLKTRSDSALIREIAFCGVLLDALPTCDDGIQNGDETSIDCGGSCPPCEKEVCPIELSSAMFFDAQDRPITKSDGIIALADEPNVPDPSLPWLDPWYDNASAYLDLGAIYHLDSIFLYDGYGSGNFKVRPGRPIDRTAVIVDFETNAWPPTWRGFELNVSTRYLTFRKGSPGAKINEIRLCGTKLEELPNLSRFGTLSAAIQPNPSNGQSILQYELEKNSPVKIQLWNITGQKIRSLFNRQMLEGVHTLSLNEQLSAGLYLIEIQTNSTSKIIKWVVE